MSTTLLISNKKMIIFKNNTIVLFCVYIVLCCTNVYIYIYIYINLIIYHYKILMIPFIAHGITSENQSWAQPKAYKMFFVNIQ